MPWTTSLGFVDGVEVFLEVRGLPGGPQHVSAVIDRIMAKRDFLKDAFLGALVGGSEAQQPGCSGEPAARPAPAPEAAAEAVGPSPPPSEDGGAEDELFPPLRDGPGPEYKPLACPAPSRGVSQARTTRAYQAGVAAGNLLAGRGGHTLAGRTSPWPAEERRWPSQCWVVLVGCDFADARPSLHYITGREVGFHERVKGNKDKSSIFHGFPSASEAWAYLAGAGFAPQHVVERPMRY